MKKQIMKVPAIELEWSDWIPWDSFKTDARKGGVKVPSKISGVYEVRYKNKKERLTIGKASDLRHRIKQCLVKGNAPHSAGKKIRANEEVSRIVVRWATTDRPAMAEEVLHMEYKSKFNKLPKYVEYT